MKAEVEKLRERRDEWKQGWEVLQSKLQKAEAELAETKEHRDRHHEKRLELEAEVEELRADASVEKLSADVQMELRKKAGADRDRLAEALRWMTDAGDAEDPLEWAVEAQERARVALEGEAE